MNSLRVDVILETELRSASPVDVKFIAKTVGGLLLALLAGGVVYYVWGARTAERRLADIKGEWETTSRVEQRVRQDKNDLRLLTEIVAEIEGWKNSRILWHQHLADFQALVPPNIQITSFQLEEQVPMMGKNAARVFSLNLQGRAEGDNPRRTVDGFLDALRHGSGFSNLVEKANVVMFDTVPGAKMNLRVFTISIKYKPRSY